MTWHADRAGQQTRSTETLPKASRIVLGQIRIDRGAEHRSRVCVDALTALPSCGLEPSNELVFDTKGQLANAVMVATVTPC